VTDNQRANAEHPQLQALRQQGRTPAANAQWRQQAAPEGVGVGLDTGASRWRSQALRAAGESASASPAGETRVRRYEAGSASHGAAADRARS
jgi:hypothetical protein